MDMFVFVGMCVFVWLYSSFTIIIQWVLLGDIILYKAVSGYNTLTKFHLHHLDQANYKSTEQKQWLPENSEIKRRLSESSYNFKKVKWGRDTSIVQFKQTHSKARL